MPQAVPALPKRYHTFPVKRPGVDVLVTLQFVFEDGEWICGLRWLEGKIDLKPKAMRRAMLEELTTIERLCCEAGFKEMRHSGDDRAVFLPGYERMPELPNGRRKRL